MTHTDLLARDYCIPLFLIFHQVSSSPLLKYSLVSGALNSPTFAFRLLLLAYEDIYTMSPFVYIFCIAVSFICPSKFPLPTVPVDTQHPQQGVVYLPCVHIHPNACTVYIIFLCASLNFGHYIGGITKHKRFLSMNIFCESWNHFQGRCECVFF